MVVAITTTKIIVDEDQHMLKDLVYALQTLGFTEYEARIYLELHLKGSMTGYEISKLTGIPRTNTYSSVQSLVDKGGGYRIEGEPARYVCTPIDELAEAKRSQLEETLTFIKGNLPKPVEPDVSIITLSGDASILQKMKHLIREAKISIYLDIWTEELESLSHLLLDAYARGVEVVLVSVGDTNIKLTEVIDHGRKDEWAVEEGRALRLITDSRMAITGTVGKESSSRAIYSTDPSLVDVVKESIIHDILLSRMRSVEIAAGHETK